MMERRTFLNLAGLGAGLGLAGLGGACANIPGQTPPPNLFRLTPKSTFADDLPTVDWQLILEPPVANAGLDTTRIALQRTPLQIEFFARSGWSDRGPLMVQTLMIESFENSGKIVSVGRESVGLRADFVLKSELREFQAEYLTGPIPKVNVAMALKLVQMPRREIIGSESFDSLREAEGDNIEAVVAAFDDALGSVLRKCVNWTIQTGEAAWQAQLLDGY